MNILAQTFTNVGKLYEIDGLKFDGAVSTVNAAKIKFIKWLF